MSGLTGWENIVDAGSPTAIVSNPSPGALSSRFALRLGNAEAFSGGVRQQVSTPSGIYRLTLQARGAGTLDYGRVVVTGPAGETYTLDLNRATNGFEEFSLGSLALSGGPATVQIEAPVL